MKKGKKQLEQYLNELRVVEPNDLGIPFLNSIYRRINGFFKTAPFLFVIPLAFIGAGLLVFVFGYLAIRLVSLLQYGF